MSRRRRPAHSNHDRWLVSYADFITLLFAFFVVLYASSKADQKKQAQVAQAIDSAFSSLGMFQKAPSPGRGALARSDDKAVTPVNIVMGDEMAAAPRPVQEDFRRIQQRLQSALSNQIAQHVVALHIGRDGLVISLREAGFFNSGSASPHPNSLHSLQQIGSALVVTPYDIRIEGHTDNVPIHTAQFASNWELSTARATEMAKLFIEQYSFAPQRLSASGYAEFHPIASNLTDDGRSQNRRVDIIVLPRHNGEPVTSAANDDRTLETAAAAETALH